MILEDNEVEARLSSPLNLLNRMRALTEVESLVKPVLIPEVVNENGEFDDAPSISDLVDNFENKIAGGKAYTNALGVLGESVQMLRAKLHEVEEPKQLSRIASEMSKIVNGFNEQNKNKNMTPTVIVYKPVVNNEQHYETVYANE